MKKLSAGAGLLGLLLLSVVVVHAQDDSVRVRNGNNDQPYKEGGFRKENLFTGGGVTVSFFSGGSVLGASPVLGYKFNDYFDGGIVLNYNYSGSRDIYEYNDKLRQHVFGPGVFVRGYPISFLFLQAQFEQNFTNVRYTSKNGGTSSYNANAPSLLLGGGYSTGRIKGGTTFFYISVLADVLKNRNSPYVDISRNQQTGEERVTILPIIRAGVNVGLFQGRYGRY
ncbi:hypothetical protein [Niabella beijingensis]|uniref:hypothetical protein n=1 Tax=Niabella beijingensis TaxID=2872700 RepID=UPI001CBF5537|nr:hypothetical protein [Niabella beijingensis]MBZ4188487.1 hypothetical protein [Niabella beijingensis]